MAEQCLSVPPYQIKSRPGYGVLHLAEQAQRHLIAAEGPGIQAVQRIFAEATGTVADLPARTTLLYLGPEAEVADLTGLAELIVVSDQGEAIERWQRLLQSATMGTACYAVGSESFLGRAVQHAALWGVHPDAMITELCGSLARRVQCVHCKHTAEEVTTSIYDCPGCGLSLFVRDHYSRRLAAYQGVCANAEDPEEKVVSEEIYP